MSGLAKPTLTRAVIKAMINAGSDAPGYRELDGTTYRVLDFHGDADVPKYLRERFKGAIAEWANDSEEMTALTLYRNLEEFGHDFARIDITAEKI
jgi:hypothetical protein